jgi:hypothetical protein
MIMKYLKISIAIIVLFSFLGSVYDTNNGTMYSALTLPFYVGGIVIYLAIILFELIIGKSKKIYKALDITTLFYYLISFIILLLYSFFGNDLIYGITQILIPFFVVLHFVIWGLQILMNVKR